MVDPGPVTDLGSSPWMESQAGDMDVQEQNDLESILKSRDTLIGFAKLLVVRQ